MPTVKKLRFANGTDIDVPVDLSLETASNSLPVYPSDAAFLAGPPAVILREGLIYLNSTLDAPRMYIDGAWRTGLMQNNSADPTKTVVLDTDGTTTGKSNTLDFNSTDDRVYTFPDISATVVLTLGAQELEDKTIKNGFLDGTKIKNGALDVEAAGALTIGATVGGNNLTLGGINSTVQIPGNLTVSGTTITVNTDTLDVEDKNITVNKGGNDAVSEGAGITVDRTGTKGSLIYKASAPNKFAAGDLGSEKNIAAIDDINVDQLSGTLLPSKGGTGVANNDAATLTRSGNHALTMTTTAASSVTLPTAGTLATVAGAEDLLNKNISSTALITGALKVPVGLTAERPAGAAADLKGMIRYNDTDDAFEGYNELTGWAPIGGGGGGGTVVTVAQANSFIVGDVLYLNGSTYEKAIATAANTAEVVGVVSAASPANFQLTLSGEVTGIPYALTTGEAYFLSPTTAGLMTLTEPSVIGQVSVPIGVASGTNKIYVSPKRGIVVGGVNARAEVALTSGAVTNVQSVAGMTAGELAGWVFISSAAPKRFYISAKFALSGAGGDYNLSYQTSGDTPPAGFLVDITTTGMIRVTLPAASGSTSVINYALNAPAIGASFPLTVSARSVIGDTSGTAAPVGYLGEFVQATLNSDTTITSISSTTQTDITGSTITLTPGVWMISYSLPTFIGGTFGTSGGLRANIRVTDSSNNLVSKTISFMQFGDGAISGFSSLVQQMSSSTVITISTTTSYKLRAMFNQNGTVTSPQFILLGSGSSTALLSDPDSSANFYAVRIA
jgi:hypothetical protein